MALSKAQGIAVWSLVGSLVVLLTVAARAEALRTGLLGNPQVLLVPLVGAAFMLAGLVVRRPMYPGVAPWLWVGVGIAWLLPSLIPATVLWHQAILLCAVAILAPQRRWATVTVAALAGFVAAGVIAQPGVAAAFVVVSFAGMGRTSRRCVLWWLRAIASWALAATFASLWVWGGSGQYDPAAALLCYEMVLLGVVALVAAWPRVVVGRALRMQNRLLEAPAESGLDGLAPVLREVVGDPSLRILRQGADRHVSADSAESGDLAVRDGAETVLLVHSERVAADPVVADAVARAVRMVWQWEQRLAETAGAQAALEGALVRTRRSVMEERSTMAQRMRAEVLGDLEELIAVLDGMEVGRLVDAIAVDALAAAQGQLREAAASVAATVTEVPRGLLPGDLRGTLRTLTARAGATCSFIGESAGDPASAVGGWAMHGDVERALFYVCSEALANAHKHARASRVTVLLVAEETEVVLRVSDDGVGGADPAGPGLRGLADRLRPLGGDLRVLGTPGAGTTVLARVPRWSQSAATRVQARTPRYSL